MKTYDERTQSVKDKLSQMRVAQKGRKKVTTAIIASATAIALALVLFLPVSKNPPDVERHSKSPYYELIKKINRAAYVAPGYDNRFQLLYGAAMGSVNEIFGVKGDTTNLGIPNAAPGDAGMMESSGYVEVTDNQVQGVIEADLFKRSSEYIFYLRDLQLSVYSIAAEESTKVGSHTISGFGDTYAYESKEDIAYATASEMYLSEDGSTVTVLLDAYDTQIGSCTVLVNLDVSDPENIRETGRIHITGNYHSSRMTDDSILLVSHFRIRAEELDFDDESTFLPQVGQPGDMHSVAAEDIFAPEELSNLKYTVICKLDANSFAVTDTSALLSYSDQLYVSEDMLFATRTFSHREEGEDGYQLTKTMTEITGIAYRSEAMDFAGSITVEGSVKNQYSMDAFEGILRVVTSTSESALRVMNDGELSSATSIGTKRNANLYCVDLASWTVCGSVEAFAPEGESAESVRFDGYTGYVCTAEVITLTDPVYFFDLQDPENITWSDTGTIDGYSTSLIQLGDGFLMGIGFGDVRQLKIEVYERENNAVVSVDAWEEHADFSQEYKSYFIDRENHLIGISLRSWETGCYQYLLLQFDGYTLNEVLRHQFSNQHVDMNCTRACMIDGYLYMLTDIGLVVETVF